MISALVFTSWVALAQVVKTPDRYRGWVPVAADTRRHRPLTRPR